MVQPAAEVFQMNNWIVPLGFRRAFELGEFIATAEKSVIDLVEL
jgi:hypothetical protein